MSMFYTLLNRAGPHQGLNSHSATPENEAGVGQIGGDAAGTAELS